MVVTPLLFMVRDRLAASLSRGDAREFDTVHDDNSRVIVAGFGRFGQITARLLRYKKIPFTALEVNPTQVDFVRRFGNRIYYGDASRVDLLRAAGADRADLFILAIDDPEASVRTAKAVRRYFPGLKIVARARNRQHAMALLGMNIDYVIRETFLSSLDAARQALESLGLTTAEARDAIRTFRDYDENMLRDQVAFKDDEKRLIESAKQAAEELERLFEQDARERT
jgi:glutathione-regulated potassium-efflux system ancillary protein KefC